MPIRLGSSRTASSAPASKQLPCCIMAPSSAQSYVQRHVVEHGCHVSKAPTSPTTGIRTSTINAQQRLPRHPTKFISGWRSALQCQRMHTWYLLLSCYRSSRVAAPNACEAQQRVACELTVCAARKAAEPVERCDNVGHLWWCPALVGVHRCTWTGMPGLLVGKVPLDAQ